MLAFYIRFDNMLHKLEVINHEIAQLLPDCRGVITLTVCYQLSSSLINDEDIYIALRPRATSRNSLVLTD